MSYQASLSSSQKLVVSQVDLQTAIAVTSITQGQQQSQTSSFTTGNWQKPPKLFRQDRMGYVLQIFGDLGVFYVALTSNSISSIAKPDLSDAISVDLDNAPQHQTTNFSFATMPPMQPMQPMQPMRMGNMSMNLNAASNSMSMSMGNMSLNMGKTRDNSRQQNFCTQCGTKTQAGDRFCRNCGNDLSS